MRTRHDVAGLTSGDATTAETGDWHPVLDTYARGVALMRQLAADDPGSWIWAANTHQFPMGTQHRPGWGQCEHGALLFLPWHRAYLAWFESTVRRLTGDDTWALPYWDYSNSDNPSARHLPVEFTVQKRMVAGESVENPLFSAVRDSRPLMTQNVDIVAALSEPLFVRTFPKAGFGGTDRPGRYFGKVEDKPHNFVHGDIGGDMSLTTMAARDPIFWLHHANIDRLWEVWRGLPGSTALTDGGPGFSLLVSHWRSATFSFGDLRAPTTYTMAEVEDLSSPSMQYQYESLELPAAIDDEVAAARGALVGPGGGGFGLDEFEPSWEPVAATFNLESGEDRDLTFSVAPHGLEAIEPSGLILELAGVRAVRPHAVYVVEIRSSPEAEPHVCGRFSTFGLEGTPEREERNYLVDATSVLPDLLEEGWTGGRLSVRVVPEPGRPDSEDSERGIHVRQVTVYAQTP